MVKDKLQMPTNFIAVPWQTGHFSSLVITGANGLKRTLHLIKSSPKVNNIDSPDIEILYLCEYNSFLYNPDGSYGRYWAPPELWATPIYGSPRGDTGYRIPGFKHANSAQIRVRAADLKLQVLSISRQTVDGPFWGQITTIPEIQVIG